MVASVGIVVVVVVIAVNCIANSRDRAQIFRSRLEYSTNTNAVQFTNLKNHSAVVLTMTIVKCVPHNFAAHIGSGTLRNAVSHVYN